MERRVLLFVVALALVVIFGLIFVALHIAPIFTFYLVSICLSALLFIFTEQWLTHNAIEYENRFWTLIALILARTFFLVEDSPFCFPDGAHGVAWFIVGVCAFLAHNFERHLRRQALSQAPKIRRINSAEFPSEYRASAAAKIIELRSLLSSIDQTWFSSTFLNIFFLPHVLLTEGRIIAIMEEAHSDELNIIMQNIELALLFHKIKDHKVANTPNRSKLLTLLGSERVAEMNLPARALMLDALQRLKLSAHPLCEQFVKNIITKTKADDLSELKCLTDSKGEVESMHQLLYVDMKNAEIRDTILKYIAQQAKVQAAHNLLGSKRGKERGRFAWRKILSDVDDTLTSSGGSWPAGMDETYPHKAIYPGVMAFYRELDVGASLTGSEEWDDSRDGNLVFLSARPHVYKDMSESVSYKKFATLQKDRGLYTSPSLLAGSLDTGGQYMVKDDPEPLAIQKFRNFKQYLTIYPEFSCIFVGDNGQGDVRTAEMVLEDPGLRDNLQRVYVHRVKPLHETHTKHVKTRTGSEGCKGAANPKICYFNTYIDAAVDALSHKLIRATGLRRIMEEAKIDFELITLAQWNHKTAKKASGVANNRKVELPHLATTTAATTTTTTAAASVVPIIGDGMSTPRRSTDDMVSSAASTPPGLDVHSGGLYSASAPLTPDRSGAASGRTRANSTTSSATKAAARTFTIVPIKKRSGGVFSRSTSTLNRVSNISGSKSSLSSGEVRRELALRHLNQSIADANKVLVQNVPPLEPVSPVPYSMHSNLYIGAGIDTMFGRGEITDFRRSDGIYEILVSWENGTQLSMYVSGSSMTF